MYMRRSFSRYPIEWLFPVLILVGIFTIYPFAYALFTSLFRIILILPENPFIGLKNYTDVITDLYFIEALLNTLLLTLITAPLITIISLGIARLLLLEFKGRGILRSLILLPWAIPGTVAGIIWLWIFNSQWGVLNGFLYNLGIINSYIPWLTDPKLAKLSVMVAHSWTQIPFATLLLMIGLTTINKELYESAEIDGASSFQRLLYITIPQIRGTLVLVLIYEAIMGITSYDVPYALTGGGPGGATTLLSYFVWAESFKRLDFGRGAALGIIMAIITFIFIQIILKSIPNELIGEEEE